MRPELKVTIWRESTAIFSVASLLNVIMRLLFTYLPQEIQQRRRQRLCRYSQGCLQRRLPAREIGYGFRHVDVLNLGIKPRQGQAQAGEPRLALIHPVRLGPDLRPQRLDLVQVGVQRHHVYRSDGVVDGIGQPYVLGGATAGGHRDAPAASYVVAVNVGSDLVHHVDDDGPSARSPVLQHQHAVAVDARHNTSLIALGVDLVDDLRNGRVGREANNVVAGPVNRDWDRRQGIADLDAVDRERHHGSRRARRDAAGRMQRADGAGGANWAVVQVVLQLRQVVEHILQMVTRDVDLQLGCLIGLPGDAPSVAVVHHGRAAAAAEVGRLLAAIVDERLDGRLGAAEHVLPAEATIGHVYGLQQQLVDFLGGVLAIGIRIRVVG